MQPTNPNEASTVRQTQTEDVYPRLHKEIETPRQILDEPARVTPLRVPPERRKLYVPVKGKFIISTAFASVWISVSWFLAQHWLAELAQVVGDMPAAVIVFFIALLPGFLNAHILSSVILDRPPKLRLDIKFPKISLLIAAYNEEENISETIRGIKNQDYPAQIEIIIVDDGSSDNTVSLLRSFNLPNLKIIRANHDQRRVGDRICPTC